MSDSAVSALVSAPVAAMLTNEAYVPVAMPHLWTAPPTRFIAPSQTTAGGLPMIVYRTPITGPAARRGRTRWGTT